MSNFPEFARLSTGISLRLLGKPTYNFATYYRDSGDWVLMATFKNGVICVHECYGNERLNGHLLEEIEENDYITENSEYI